MKSSGPTASPAAEVSATSADEADSEIEETDIRILKFYGDGDDDGQTLVGLGEDYGYAPVDVGDDNGQTLVGLGPPSSRSPVSLSNTQPSGRVLARSEPPGPWGSDEDEPLAPSLRPRKTGIWAAAVPLLLVAAAVVVVALRGLAPSTPRSAAVGLPPATERSAREGTGLFVRHMDPELRVTVDGIDQGPPPVLLMELEPGSHFVTVFGPGYAPYEQTVTLSANRVSTLEPVLERSDAPPTAEARSADAPALESASSRKPTTVTPSGRSTRTRLGSAKPIPVELDETPENPYLPGSLGVLAASSSPPATVVVDGRPVGKSPRVVDLPPGPHTIAFVHPTQGRKSMTVKITPGNTTNVAVDF